MLIITTVYVSHVEPVDETDEGAELNPVKLEEIPKIIESKLLEQPDANRKLVIVYAGTNRAQIEGSGNRD